MDSFGGVFLGLLALIAIGLSLGELLTWMLGGALENDDNTRAATTGSEALIGRRVEAVSVFEASRGRFEGWVDVGGERWRARTECVARPGDTLTIVAIDGLVLDVARRGGSD